jgi:hypothetical protein
LSICVEFQTRDTRKAGSSKADFRIYIRREGAHFVGLCGELRAIVDGATVEQVVSKTTNLIAEALLGYTGIHAPRVLVYAEPASAGAEITG